MECLASMYIDDELDLHEKVDFLVRARSEEQFYQEALGLLRQEMILRNHAVMGALPARAPLHRGREVFRPLVHGGVGFVLAVLLLVQPFFFPGTGQSVVSQRFVIYQPAANRVELTGTFNGWQRVAMKRIGTSGYWELKLPVPAGEHRFAYILDGSRRMADPTEPSREKDDYGSENSVVKISTEI